MGSEHKILLAELTWLRRVARGLVGDDSAAADLTQEVALEMLRRPPHDPGVTENSSRLRAWLWTVARRKASRERAWSRAQDSSERAASRAEVTDIGSSSAQQLALHRDLLTEIVLYAESSIAAEAQFVDALNDQPEKGFAFVLSYDATGKRLGPTLAVGLDDDGRLRLPTRQRASIHDVNWIPCHRYEIQVAKQSFRVALTRPGEAEDLGTFKVERAPFVHLRLRVRSKNGLEPLRGVVDSGEEALWSEADGDVRIRANLGTVVRVLAAGHALREVVVEPGTQNEETPQIIELQPAARLGVRFEQSSRDGLDPNEPVKIELRSREPLMAGLPARIASRRRSRFDLYDHFYGAQLDRRVGSTSDGKGAAHFQGLPGRTLWIDGLHPGARFDVIVRDSKGEALASESVAMPVAHATEPLLVELAAHWAR